MTHQHEHTKPGSDSVTRGHETTDADAKSVAISGIALTAGSILFGLLVSWGAYSVFKSYSSAPGSPSRTLVVADSTRLPPLPRLQTDPHVTLVPFVRSQDSILASYGWVNKDSGIAQIPIERAMKLVVQQGLPVQGK